MKHEDQQILARALSFALKAHQDQTRKGRDTPYVAHPLQVAGLVLEHGGTPALAAAGLLHDVVEDCDDIDEEVIRGEFGPEVARVVAACTDTLPGDASQEKSPWLERKRRYLAQVGAADRDVHLVVACDKLHNLGALVGDLRVEGAATLERFSASPRQTRWYYEEVRRLLDATVPGPLLGHLDDLLAQLRGFIDEASPER